MGKAAPQGMCCAPKFCTALAWWLKLFMISWCIHGFLTPPSWQWNWRMRAGLSSALLRGNGSGEGEEEVLEPRGFLLQVCLEGAAGSAWMQRGGKLVGMTLEVLPRTGACILVGISALCLEALKLE